MALKEHEIPTVVMISDGTLGTKGIATSVVIDATASEDNDIFVDTSIYDITHQVVNDTVITHFITTEKASINDIDISLTMDDIKYEDTDIVATLITALKELGLDNLEVELYIASFLKDDNIEITNDFRINISTIPTTYDTSIEIYIWGVKFFNLRTDMCCVGESVQSILDVGIEQASGKITKLATDVTSTAVVNKSLDTYLCNTAVSISGSIEVDLENTPGRLAKLDSDIASVALRLNDSLYTEIKTRSLFTGNFFIESDKFTTASSIAWVDIVDYLYPINLDNTYLNVNDVTVSGIWFTDIPNGKRLYYNPIDDFYSDGVLTYTLHSENSIGEIEDKIFYLLYGYNIELNEVVDWGPNNKVVVRLEAENLAFCPNTTSAAFDFVTTDLISANLNCFISPVGYVDFPISIYPQSKAFFYDKTYTIRVTGVKDFSGNLMPDFNYTFTIESPSD